MVARFSIIIPTYNRISMVLEAIHSVKLQEWPEIEIIVIDGGSTDGTQEVLSDVPGLIIRSARDDGVYDALNKGMALAKGDIVGLLNSDDWYEPGTFFNVSAVFESHPDADAVCGSSVVVDKTKVVQVFDNERDMTLSARTALIGSCMPNARFFRRHAMLLNGNFSLTYKIVSDRDWLLRWHESGRRTIALRQPVYRYRQHQQSLTFDADRKRELEIRHELIALARNWRASPTASYKTKAICTFLDGRCLATLAIMHWRRGNYSEALSILFRIEGRFSFWPVIAITLASFDWMLQKARAPKD